MQVDAPEAIVAALAAVLRRADEGNCVPSIPLYFKGLYFS
jgi:hypothetical protein